MIYNNTNLNNPINNHELLKILNNIKDNNITIIEPLFNPDGGFSYPIMGQYSIEEQILFFESCLKIGIFIGKPSISLLSCRYCNSISFYIKFICTFCKSSNIIRAPSIEHDRCGNIDFEYKFISLDGKLICEKCNKQLKAIGVDYSKLGYFYKCLECKAMLSNTDQFYICLKCGRSSLYDELQILQLFTYTVNLQKLIEKLNADDFLFFVTEELDRIGIKSKQLDTIVGISKIPHIFPLVVYDDKKNPFVIVDTIQSENNNNNKNKKENDENIKILSFIAKCLDVKVSNKIILAIPSLNKNLRELININKIILVESNTTDDALLELSRIITEIYNKGEMII